MNHKMLPGKKCLTLLGVIGAVLNLQMPVVAANLITNGTFSAGNTGFTNGYVFTTVNSGGGGEYTVTANPQDWNASLQSPPAWVDHTATSDNLALLINGSPLSGRDCWRQSIAVAPGTGYSVSGWATDSYPGVGGEQAQLQFFVNGFAIGSPFTVADQTGTPNWQKFSAVFHSGGASNVILSLRDLNTAWEGNDVAIDDLVMELGTNLPPNPPQCAAMPTDVVSWWRAETNGNDSADGNPAALVNGLTFAPGEVGQAFAFNGVNSHARVAASASLNVGTNVGMTVEGWINPSDVTSGRPLVEWNDGANVGAHFWLCLGATTPGLFGANLLDTSGNSHVITSGGGVISANTFQHVGLTYDKSTGIARLFRNGVVVAQANLGTFTPRTAYDMFLGHRPPGGLGTGTFAGLIDELTIYRRALTTNEIAGIFAAGTAGKCVTVVTNPPVATNCTPPASGLIGWWPGQGNANDIIGGRNGVLYSGTTFGTGEVGQAFSFDGLNDSIINAVGGIKSVTNSFTMEFWAWPSAGRNSTPETDQGIYGTGGQRYAIYPDFGDLGPVGAGVSVGTNGISVFEHGYAYMSSLLVYDAPITGWTHVAVVYENRQPRLYVNGNLVRTGLVSTRIPYPSTYFGEAGANSGNYGYYRGLLDEVSIYNRSLSAPEVLSVFNASIAGKCTSSVTNPPPQPTNCVAAPTNLVGWWPLNGDWADVVAGNTGVPAGSSVFAAGAVGQAMVFDGVTNSVRLPATAALNVGAGNGMTIEMWIKPADVAVEQQLAEWNNGAGFIGAHFSLAIAALGGGPGSLWCNLTDAGGGDHKLSTVQGLVVTNAYQHVALTYDKASGLTTIYRNGSVAAQANLGSFTPYTGSDLYLGTRPTGAFAGLRYRGGMDEVSVYGRALSASEIQAIYNAGSAGKCSPVITNPPPVTSCVLPISAGVTNPANGHVYLLLAPTNWNCAEATAVALGGHLVTINDAAENLWVYNTFANFDGVTRPLWIGLNDQAVEGTWVWTSGDPSAYRQWAPGEPNSGGGVYPDEDVGIMRGPNWTSPDSWNDAPEYQIAAGVVEINGSLPPVPNACFSAAAAFSTNSNPNGVWRYGYSSTLGGTLIPMLERGSIDGLIFWRSNLWLGAPAVVFNPSSNTVTSTTVTFAPRQLAFHPGPGGEFSVIRFSSPSNAVYRIVGSFSGVDNQGTTTDVHILKNGAAFFNGLVNGFGPGSGPSFDTNLNLAVGDRLEFAVGRGANNEFSFDTTGIEASLCVVSNLPPGSTNPPPCATLPAGVVSWWRAEDNALDSVDGNHGTLAGNVTYGAGRVGRAFVLDGNRDGVRVGTGTNLQLQNFTIEAWIKRSSATQASFNGNGNGELFVVGTNPGGFGLRIDQADNRLVLGKSGGDQVSSAAMITDTNWHHLAVTKQGTAVSFYVDGVAYAAPAYNPGPFTFSAPAYIGAWFNPFGEVDNSFYGAIDEMTVYNRGLTANEIQAIFAASTVGKCVTVVTNPPVSTNCTVSPAGLISWWRSEGNAFDSADGNHGTATNGVTYPTGKVGQAFGFDGVNDVVIVPNRTNLNPTGSFSIEGWIRPTANNAGIIIGKWGDQGSYLNNRSYIFRMQGNRGLELGISDFAHQNDIGFHQFSVTNVIATGVWSHVAGVYDQATGIRSLYVNGVQVGQKTNPPITIYNSIARVTIGAWSRTSTSTTNHFRGNIDELSLYGRALTVAEIAAIYDAGVGGKCVPPSNLPPQAIPQAVSLFEDGTTNIVLSGFDPDANPLTYLVVNGPTNGTLTGTAPNLVYTPTANYFGPDSFRFRVNDGQTSSAPATVTINVLPVNDVPEAQSQSISTDEDTALAITLGASDADGDPLTYGLTAPLYGSLSGTPPNLTYTPNTNYNGPDSFTFSVSDAQTNSNTATVSITVRAVNDPPIARIEVSPLTQVLGITNQVVITAVCGEATVILDGSSSTDVENDPLTFAWTEGTNWLGATAIVTNQFAIGTHEITLTVNDGALDGSANKIIEVVTPAQGLGIIVAYIEESGLGRANGRPLIATLKNAAAAFDRCDLVPAVNQLEAFQNKVRAQITPVDADLAAKLIEAAQQIMDAVQPSPSP